MARHGEALHRSVQSWLQVCGRLHHERPDHLLVPSNAEVCQLRLNRQHHEACRRLDRELLPRPPQWRGRCIRFHLRSGSLDSCRDSAGVFRKQQPDLRSPSWGERMGCEYGDWEAKLLVDSKRQNYPEWHKPKGYQRRLHLRHLQLQRLRRHSASW